MTFRDSFKFYKARKPPPDLSEVIDIRNPDGKIVKKVNVSPFGAACISEQLQTDLDFKPVENWNVFEFPSIPGLLVIENPFKPESQRKWILKCLRDYPCKPNITNLDAHDVLENGTTWWDACCGLNPRKDLVSKLRWTTLGYHHNWDTKQYSEDLRTKMPEDLTHMTKYFAKVLGFHDFEAEAAIVNYYRMNSTLAGHTDHSEVNLDAPLFSISFGQSAVFLIGGPTQEEPAHAMYLRSGDVMVMSTSSRLRYHGVPKILYDPEELWNSKDSCVIDDDWIKAKSYIADARINVNVRQVLMPGQLSL
ncbi:nucleic acid dioxygenase ALKBH1 [Trichogramma pretiosum]|uniref:nucleic acid dioxygenase ALKBH1 n=1 Tax=Trichogramma pretiosum TaxID=7493 RepID=UPI0006C95F0F|nr:nucleic acid dioxygenase ALKBH1 [Trichogramma pretiosum]